MRFCQLLLLVVLLFNTARSSSQQQQPCVPNNYTCGCIEDTYKALYFHKATVFGLVAYPNCINGVAPGQEGVGCAKNTLPQGDDIVSFCRLSQETLNQCDSTDDGHVAIVEGDPVIDGSNFTLTLIEQNWSMNVKQTLAGTINPDGTYTVYDRLGKCEEWTNSSMPVCVSHAYFRIQGWLRLPSSQPEFGSVSVQAKLNGSSWSGSVSYTPYLRGSVGQRYHCSSDIQ
jgi:hypothetical protein